MVRWKSFWGLAALAVVTVLSTPPPAHALFRLRLEHVGSPGSGVVVSDTNNDGIIFFSGTVGGFTVNMTTGLQQPPAPGIGFGQYAAIDLNSVNVNTTSGGTLRISLEADGFVQGSPNPLIITNSVGGAAPSNAALTFQGWANPNNLMPAYGPDTNPTGPLPALGAPPAGSVTPGVTPLSFTGMAFAGQNSATFLATGAYSIFSQATIAFGGGGGTVSFNQVTFTSPEPGTICAALAGVPVLGLWWRRRKAAGVV
jgi:hypothetical protein